MLSQAVIFRSELHPLGARLNRALDENGDPVLIAGRNPQAPSRPAALRREFEFRAALDDAWAVVPVALLPYGDGAVLVLKDPGGALLNGRQGQPFEPRQFLSDALLAATAVSKMHAAQVLHRSLTLDRILVDPAARVARLTGFCCAASAAGSASEADEEPDWEPRAIDYMAPELGGRTEAGVDARADLYALGCIFYELLTGAAPFAGSDVSARLHAHATSPPPLPHEMRPDVPRQLSRIVLRLMAKEPGQRYASAQALCADLRACEELLGRHGAIAEFTLEAGAGPDDAAGFVGREPELQQLLDAFRAVATGRGLRIGLVSGPPGLGKSTLLHEAASRMGRQGPVLVASAKGAMAGNGAPFETMAQALEPLLRIVLGSADREFAAWRERLSQAAGVVADKLAGLLPGLGAILDLAPPAPAMEPGLVEGSLGLEREIVLGAMAKLCACFARDDRPLILVLDDLQWADVETLQVIGRLSQDHADAPLLVLGSLRPPESGALAQAGPVAGLDASRTTCIALAPLSGQETRNLIGRMFARTDGGLDELAGLLDAWTGRNPFFLKRLLNRLVGEGLIRHETGASCWTWDLQQIVRHPARLSVKELLVHDLRELPEPTQAALRIVAAAGDRCALWLVAAASGWTDAGAADQMAPAVASGLVRLDDGDLVFTHDNVRDVACESLSGRERAGLHLRIARLLIERRGTPALAYAIATQARLAEPAVTQAEERRSFARVNLAAGRQAKAAAAHHSALIFFHAALAYFESVLDADGAREATLQCGEAEFMTGALDAAEARLAALQSEAGDVLFGAAVARLRAALYTTRGDFDRALEIGIRFLANAGIEIPRHPSVAEVDAEHARLSQWLERHGVQAMRDIPIDADPLRRSITDIFSELLPPAMYTDQNLVDLMLLRLTNLAIEHGHSDASPNGYVCLNQIFGVRYGDYASSKAFGELALHLVNERGLGKYRARVFHTYGTFVVPWAEPARSARAHLERAFEIATQVGDHTFALYCGRNQATGMLFAGEFLGDIRRTVDGALLRARDAGFQLVVDALLAQKMLIGELQDGGAMQESMPEPQDGAPATLVDLAYWVYRLQLDLLFGRLPGALEARRRAEACRMAGRSFAEFAELPYYGSLALLAQAHRSREEEAVVAANIALLASWDAACTENFGARLALVRAELARAQGQAADAQQLYASAVARAREQDLRQVEALAAELAAGFYAGLGRDIEHRAYLRHALGAWQRLGAAAKVRQLQQAHAHVLAPDQPAPASQLLQQLDVHAVLRISNSLASDIVLSRVVETAMRTSLESSGADFGALAVLQGGAWQVLASASAGHGGIEVRHGPTPLTAELLPVSTLLTVARTEAPVQVGDARDEPSLAHDDYVKRARPRSMLGVPMMRYARFIGVLYVENKLAPQVFTAARARLLEVIATQASFALENTRLYQELSDQHVLQMQTDERLRAALAELARSSRLQAMGELVASIVHEIGQPLTAIDTSASAAGRWLDREVPEIGEAQAMISHVSLSAKRAKSIIQSLRSMARKTEPQFADIDLREALAECVSLVAGPLAEQGVSLRSEAPERPCRVRADRVQLQQVVINLLMNGAEAMAGQAPDTRHLRLCWSGSAAGAVSIAVEDGGAGLSAEAARRLFEPFFTTKSSGMGMGLTICKSIVDAHGGVLAFHARAEGGTRAVLELPGAEPSVPGILPGV
ncbi:trifunctional serine/threonine-protein kinase/ATP-binding protein/sensor histidine kinase [Pelomonas sp. KK5]|uniref:trifunctional serine/threonine-protein kinase/ATP-binding protein/sensor histidine kinase n=1 Tax=Pelomonas sp. KK5 TaxID=1855730 RepID=UPI00097C1644|nr:trifunctional serine/threonine-protein kinase/ATP-binding protein/sensor histidine kinase [Pelomonas sp. KK5]